jgi:SAM-dependent methyltransferase
MYYSDKQPALTELFGTADISLLPGALVVKGVKYPIVDDVIILSGEAEYTPLTRKRLVAGPKAGQTDIALDIQATFGAEWQEYSQILPEHEKEFQQYFDIVDIEGLKNSRVLDVGCGSGRWSYFLKDKCSQLVLTDFSDAIFVARDNLRGNTNALFFMCDLRKLPFADDCVDFLMCLGVLHHLPVPCLGEVRRLKRLAPKNLIFLYYALDNRPFYFRVILFAVSFARKILSALKASWLRRVVSVAGAVGVYLPLVIVGKVANLFSLGKYVPLYEFYNGKSLARIEQDVYDRFFTRIEQRVSRKELMALQDTYSRVLVADTLPYYHFVCER